MDDCIEWELSRNIKTKNRFDYGQVRVGKKMKKAHRVAWEKEKGPIPKGMLVLHKCDNPPCVNINHLFLGTHSTNALDREAKGRGRDSSGIKNKKAKIQEQTAIRIKMLKGVLSASLIARTLGISANSVCRIMNDEAWKHVTANTRYAF